MHTAVVMTACSALQSHNPVALFFMALKMELSNSSHASML
jgi:hypothetical protein